MVVEKLKMVFFMKVNIWHTLDNNSHSTLSVPIISYICMMHKDNNDDLVFLKQQLFSVFMQMILNETTLGGVRQTYIVL